MCLSSSFPGILNFCANNYLGLSSHPQVIEAGQQALEEFGAGLSSVRFICGTQVPGGGEGAGTTPAVNFPGAASAGLASSAQLIPGL